MRVPFEELTRRLRGVLTDIGFDDDRASLLARLFAEASLDGVASHGLNRFPRFVRQVKAGLVDPRVEPLLVESCGAWERWDGRRGAGPVNAWQCTTRAVSLARAHGIGCVGLANTNHWMRGGTYGWQAAAEGCALLAWTNTLCNMAAWGSDDPRLGNNPLVVAMPGEPTPVVLDMAMSQFAIGKLESVARRGGRTEVPAGWDERGEPTTDAAAVLRSRRVMPTGYWKGAGLALMLDLLAMACSGGRSSREIAADPEQETGVSQVYVAIDLARSCTAGALRDRVASVIEHFASASPIDPAAPVRYPGQRALEARRENLALGVPVDEEAWREALNQP
jgi:3-dehydro-L-gulonate 2-dehydrogenase